MTSRDPERNRSWRGFGSRLSGTGDLAVNGGALVVNVITGGLTGFVFWILVARNADQSVVSEEVRCSRACSASSR